MTAKEILRIAPALSSLALVNKSLRLARKKKIRTKDIVDTGVTNIVGTALIHEQSKLVENLD